MAKLIIRNRGGDSRVVELTTKCVVLGRGENCDVVLSDDAEVSREHADVCVDEQGYVLVTDRNSKNGTRVDNGDVFRNTTQIAYSSIRIGDREISVVGSPPPPVVTDQSVIFTPDSPARMANTSFFPSTKRLDLNHQRLSLLMGLSDRLGSTFERKELLEQALEACCEALGFERGLIALKTPRGEPELPVTRNITRDATGAYKVSRTLINRALVHGERAVVNNPATDLIDNLSESMVRFPVQSALCVPILYRDEVFGVIYGDRITKGITSPYTPADVDFLAAIAQQVGIGVANLRLFQEHVRSQRMFAELEQARRIQQQLLPAAPLVLGRYRVQGHNEPSSAVSGDYFDYFPLSEHRIGLIIADVTGHGLAAALMMANLQAAVHVALSGDISLPDLAMRINRLVCRNTASNVFITAILGTVDTRTGMLEYVSAGHPAPIVLSRRGVHVPEHENSLPLGLEPGERYEVWRIEPSDAPRAVLFYTDGLYEAASPGGQMLTIHPVKAALAELPDSSPEAVINSALSVVRGHLQSDANTDDMTLMALQIE